MAEAVSRMLGVVAAALGLVSMPDATAIGVAIALVAVAVLTIAIALTGLPIGATGAPHPLRAIDVGALLAQSDPDAAGHPRPRAPGVAVSA